MRILEAEHLAAITGRDASDARKYVRPLNHVMHRYRIDTLLREAHFVAQIAHESVRFRYTEEIWGPTEAQRGYEGREDLGNTQPGDGYRYRGRGLMQLTGRTNYRQYTRHVSETIGEEVNFVRSPDLVAKSPWCVDVAGWYWASREINRAADENDTRWVTRLINGGYNGYEDRLELTGRAIVVLGEVPDLPYEAWASPEEAGVLPVQQLDAGNILHTPESFIVQGVGA